MNTLEEPLVFNCSNEQLVGIIHRPTKPFLTGVVIIVGGPQYRVGSHRQFLLLARHLANQGIPVMRFDYRGMGDSSGKLQTFENINEDIYAAIDAFMQRIPELRKIVIWGLCDAAAAGLMYAYRDQRVTGLVLLNPWVRTEAGEARAYLKHYYLKRLLSKQFWKKLIAGKFNIVNSLNSLLSNLKAAQQNSGKYENKIQDVELTGNLPERMLAALSLFNGRTLIILSGQDLTAAEFRDLIRTSKKWQKQLKTKSVEFKELAEANHTFSSATWRNQVAEWSLRFVKNV